MAKRNHTKPQLKPNKHTVASSDERTLHVSVHLISTLLLAQMRELFMWVCTLLFATVTHSTAHRRSHNLLSYSPDDHVNWREEISWQDFLAFLVASTAPYSKRSIARLCRRCRANKVCPWPWYIYRHVDEDPCVTDCVQLFCSSAPHT